ncbi:UNVERIFIED_CONTAM: hypothetical protein RMT77_011952 [Armadillidium vulgare]
MADKLAGYTGGFHVFSSYLKEKWGSVKERGTTATVRELKSRTGEKVQGISSRIISHFNRGDEDDYSHIYRRKTRMEMVRISAAVMGIEFCYAAETAFVSPTLLKIGVRHAEMTLIWCLSPFVGFFLTPVLGSLSDNCRSELGRRRPFIILLAIGIILGLILVPNGKLIGTALGDKWPDNNLTMQTLPPDKLSELLSATEFGRLNATVITDSVVSAPNDTNATIHQGETESSGNHPWGVFFTILGTMLLDFDADACQSPSRAYLLDVTLPEDHAIGLSTFTIMAGLGGGFGYAMGGINWDPTFIGWLFGGHVRAVFTLITFLFIGCVFCTLYSFNEIPLDVLQSESKKTLQKGTSTEAQILSEGEMQAENYGSINDTNLPLRQQSINIPNGHQSQEGSSYNPFLPNIPYDQTRETETSFNANDPRYFEETVSSPVGAFDKDESTVAKATLKQYLLSIVYMPKSLRILCLTNLFCWMSLVSYSLYFTDFVGEAVFGGDPMAPDGSIQKEVYEEGVRFGCWGMAIYSLSCSCYSFIIEKLVKRFRARPVYVCGQLVYSLGMIFMATLRHKTAVILFSCSAGIMYSTLFTMPYLLVAHYHASGTFSEIEPGKADDPSVQVRGLGTDVAIVSSMVFLAQFILSMCMGSIISAAGSTIAIVGMASFLAFCGAVSATQVVYLDL